MQRWVLYIYVYLGERFDEQQSERRTLGRGASTNRLTKGFMLQSHMIRQIITV